MTRSDYKIIWHRLKIMTPGEMWYRFNRNVRARIRKNRQALCHQEQYDVFHETVSPDIDDGELLLAALRQRRVFPWQSLSQNEIAALFHDQLQFERAATIEAAEELCAHHIKIFNRKLPFNGRIDWHYDPTAQKQIPVKHWTELPYWQSDLIPGIKYIWELNRLQHFVILARAYLLTTEEKYIQELKSQWQDWLANNPPQYGINWTSPLELAMRIISFTWSLQMCKNSPAIDADFYRRVLQSVADHAEFIADNLSFYSSANNHLLGEALGLVYAGCYYPELKSAERWRELGFSILFDQVPRQVYPDGVVKEQTLCYQRYVFDFCLLAKTAADYIGQTLPEEFSRRMEKMAEFVHALLQEANDVPHIGDADSGETVRLSERRTDAFTVLLAEAAYLFRRGDFKAKGSSWCEELFWLFGPAAQAEFHSIAAVHHQPIVQEFPQGGYVILRSRTDALPQRAVFDVGPLGLDAMSSHGHADALNFLLSVAGAPVLIDSGTYTYRGSRKWRDYFRSTQAHNTVVVDGESQSEMVGPFQWGRRAHARLLSCSVTPQRSQLLAEHDGYRHKGVMHTRRVTCDHVEHWTIEDSLQGPGRHSIQVLWHLAPCRHEISANGGVTFYFRDFILTFDIHSQAALQKDIISGETGPIQGWFSTEFAVKKQNPVLCISTTDTLPVRILTNITVKRNHRYS